MASKTITLWLRLLLSSAAVFSTACSPEESPDGLLNEVISSDRSQYALASCKYKYDEGSRAVNASSVQVHRSNFNKSFDWSILAPVLNASAAEVVRFAEMNAVKFYKTKPLKESGSCSLLASLPPAPEDLETKFTKTGDSVLGLYLEQNTPNMPTTASTSTITIRSDANKWVLVHEYMHHLFHLDNLRQGILSGEQARGELTKKLNEYQAANEALDQVRYSERGPKVLQAAAKLRELNESAIPFLKQFLLEEMAIENTLGDLYDSGTLTLVVEGQRLNGVAYTVQSSEKAKDFMKSLKRNTESFVLRHSYQVGSTALGPVQDSIRPFETIEAEIEQLRKKAKNYLESKGLDYSGVQAASFQGISVTETPAIGGCSHQHDAEVSLAEVLKLLN